MKCSTCRRELLMEKFTTKKNGVIPNVCDDCREKNTINARKRRQKIQETELKDNTKICSMCLTAKSTDDFRLKKDGVSTLKKCKQCEEKEKVRKEFREKNHNETKEKVCSKCKKVVPIEQFAKTAKGNYRKQCNPCSEIGKRARQKIKENVDQIEFDPQTEKICGKCNKVKPLSEFKERSTGGKTAHCVDCIDYMTNYMEKNKCPHGKLNKSACKECKGGSICQHNRTRTYCKECNGGSLCSHGKRKDRCKECEPLYGCNQYCEHNVLKTSCRDCKGGSICSHDKRRTRCLKCEGGSICEHRIVKFTCRECDFIGFLSDRVRGRVSSALRSSKTKHSIEYLGCSIEYYRTHLEKQFVQGMSWENYGTEWEIDHVVPLKYNNPELEEVIQRLHYKNTQPLWTEINASKGNRKIYWLQQANASTDGRLLSKKNVVKRSQSTDCI